MNEPSSCLHRPPNFVIFSQCKHGAPLRCLSSARRPTQPVTGHLLPYHSPVTCWPSANRRGEAESRGGQGTTHKAGRESRVAMATSTSRPADISPFQNLGLYFVGSSLNQKMLGLLAIRGPTRARHCPDRPIGAQHPDHVTLGEMVMLGRCLLKFRRWSILDYP